MDRGQRKGGKFSFHLAKIDENFDNATLEKFVSTLVLPSALPYRK